MSKNVVAFSGVWEIVKKMSAHFPAFVKMSKMSAASDSGNSTVATADTSGVAAPTTASAPAADPSALLLAAVSGNASVVKAAGVAARAIIAHEHGGAFM